MYSIKNNKQTQVGIPIIIAILAAISLIIMLSCKVATAQFNRNGTPAYSVDKEYSFKNIVEADGLCYKTVLDIIKDRYGYMWIATEKGLSKFDGNHFFTYKNRRQDTTSLSNDCVTSLTEDIFGNLWIGTKEGLNKYDRKRDRFIRYSAKKIPGIVSNYIRALYADKKGNLWIDCMDATLIRYEIKSGKSTHEKHITNKIEGIYYYDHIFEDSHERIWVGGRCIPAQQVTSTNPLKIKLINNNNVDYHAACYAEMKDGTVLCFDGSGQCYKYQKNKELLLFDHQTPIATKCAVKDIYGNIWIGGGGGIANFNEKKQYLPGKSASGSLLSEEVMCLYPDNKGNLWIGTDKGISIFSYSRNVVKNYVHVNKEGNQVPITALMQDSDNLLWIGTETDGVDTLNLQSGLRGNIKYSLLKQNLDAATMAREKQTILQYKLHEFNTNRYKNINENKVSTLYQDSKGKIYIGLWSHVGFNIYDKKAKSIRRYALWSEKPTMLLPNLFRGNLFGANWYADFLEDSKGNFWCATWEAIGLNLFERDKGAFSGKNFINKKIPFTTGPGSSWKDKKRNRIYFIIGRDYFYYDISQKKFIRYSNTFPTTYPNREIYEKYYKDIPHIPLNIPPRTREIQITPLSSDSIILTSREYIMIHDLKADKITKFIKTNGQFSHKLLLGRDKNTGYNYSNSTIYRADLKQGTYNKLSDYCKKAVISKDDIILYLYINLKGTLLYVGTDNGLYIYDLEQNRFSKANIKGYSGGKKIISITEESKGLIYLCTDNGISIVDNHKEHRHILQGITVNTILNIHNNRQFLVGTDSGLLVLDSKLNIQKRYTYNPDSATSISPNSIKDILEITADIYFLIRTNEEPVQVFDMQLGQFANFPDKDEYALSTRLASCIMEDNRGNIWYGTTEDGVNIIHLKSGKIRHYRYCSWDKNSLPDNNINCIKMDSDKNIWIGTGLGLYLVKNKNIPSFENIPDAMDILKKGGDKKAFFKFNTESIGERVKQFIAKEIMSVEEDSKGRLWVATSSGLFCYFVKENRIMKLPKQMGFSSSNWVKKSSVKLRDGHLVFGNDKSADIFSPDFLLGQISFPQILISDFRCGKTIRYPDISSIPEEIKLKHKHNSISFIFSAADCLNNKFTKFRYRIKGYEDRWNYSGTANWRASYTKIASGNYTLEVECTNNAGQWPGKSIDANGIYDGRYKVRLIIMPPFYMSWYFILFCNLLLITLIWEVIKFREKKIMNEKKELEKIVAQRTSDLKQEVDSKNKFFSIISHDLKNPISALGFTSKFLYDKYSCMSEKERMEYIEVIKSAFESTSDLLNSILMWVLSQRGMIKTNIRECDLRNLLLQTEEQVKPMVNEKKINFINLIQEKYIIQTDSDLLIIIVRNIINNAVKFTPKNGMITVGTIIKNGKNALYITDTGIGMSHEVIEKLFRIDAKLTTQGTQGEKGSGFGLIMSKELAMKLGYEIIVESTNGKGSTFFILMPLQDIPIR